MTLADTILGDPHLGRRFITGVPLHRRGEREMKQRLQFEDSLYSGTGDHICLGDLFDSFTVPNSVVLSTAFAYIQAATSQRKRRFFIIEGNHDVSRDTGKTSSFDVFKALVSHIENIVVVSEAAVVDQGRAFFPYHPFKTAKEIVEEVAHLDYDVAYGHWDVVDFGGSNVVPVEALRCDWIVTGHDHVRRSLTRGGSTIRVWGSMQPYSHAEDPDDQMYVTLDLEELDELDLTDMNVRLRLRPGEEPPTDLDCLSLTFLRVAEDAAEVVDMSEFESVDIEQQLAKALPDSVREELLTIYREGRV